MLERLEAGSEAMLPYPPSHRCAAVHKHTILHALGHDRYRTRMICTRSDASVLFR